MKTIVIFSGYYYPHLGGIERYVDNLRKEFVKMGYNVVLVTSNYENTDSVTEEDNFTIIKLPVYNAFKNRYPIIKHNKEFRKLMGILDNCDVMAIIVNTRFHLTSHVGAKYGVKHNIPVYLIEHGSNYVTLDNKFIDFFANRYEDFLTFKIKNKVKGFYGVSVACGKWLKNFNIDYSGTWYNSIDTNQELPKREKHDGINFLYAGRLIKQKGTDNILDAFEMLEKKYDNVKLFIAGDGPTLDSLKEKYNSKNISFLGKLTYDELVKYYAMTDVFLYPPLWPEGLPTSILEAGLMGCAVIGTNQGGICEVIKDGENGLIVDTTVSSLYEAMDELVINSSKREELAKALYETILKKFSWEVTAKNIIETVGIKNGED